MDPVDLTKRIVRIDSTNPGRLEGDMAGFLAELIAPRLPEYGRLRAADAAGQTGEELIYRKNEGDLNAFRSGIAAMKRPILMAELPGSQKTDRELVFICHMDTVPIADGWIHNPLGAEEEDGKIYGRGSCDMKSGLAASLSAFLEEAEQQKAGEERTKRSLKFICSADEEADMAGSAKALELGWIRRESLVMDCEPTDGKVQTAHRSRLWYRVTAKGKAAHASRPQDGVDAIAGMASFISGARERFQKLGEDAFLGKSTIVFGQIKGGIHPYQVPGECTVSVDIRAVPPYTAKDILKLLEDAAAEAERELPGLRCELEQVAARDWVAHCPDSEMLRRIGEAVEEFTGRKADVTAFPGYTDTAVIASALGNRNTLSYGPGSLSQAHKPEEYVEIRDIHRCYGVYRRLIEDWCRAKDER